MDWEATLKIAGGLVTLGAVTVSLAKFFSNQNKALTTLRQEIKDLKTQTNILKQPFDPASVSRPSLFQQLLAISTEARDALGADLHSISVPVPASEPTHLRIILSTDAEPEKVVGREIPLTKGIAAWVFQRKQPSFKNPAEIDPHHFNLVDKAAGTNTGGGAILTVPLISGNTCEGVIQFMKTKGGRFEESDVQLATRLAPSITRLLVQLQDSDNADVPSVAWGDIRRMTILFADITGYSDFSAKLRLQDTVGLLNEYYSRLVQFALGKGGKLEEYLGDGLYVSFFQEAAGQAARLAVITAFEMNAEYQKILYGWKEYQHPVSDRNTHRIGIASGMVYTGLVGHEDQRRSKLIGDPVDLAAHLCEDVKSFGGGIAICPQTKELIGDEWRDFKRRELAHGAAWTVTSVMKGG